MNTPDPRAWARVDVFGFPSAMRIRFGLLIFAVIGACLYIFQSLYSATLGSAQFAVAQVCEAIAEAVYRKLPEDQAVEGAYEVLFACTAPLTRHEAAFVVGGVALVALVATALFVLTPPWMIRRRKLTPLTDAVAADLLSDVQRLAQEEGLRRQPDVLWNPGDPSGRALAFGRPRRYRIAVGGGLVAHYHVDPEAIRAVLRHELGHIRNRDVAITYLTLAIWRSFLLIALPCFAVAHFVRAADLPPAMDLQMPPLSAVLSVLHLTVPSPRRAIEIAVRLMAIVLVILFTRDAILRERELYADARATLTGPAHDLLRLLQRLRHPSSRWSKLSRRHPAPARRDAAVEDPSIILAVQPWELFGVAVAATMALPNVSFLVTLLGFTPFRGNAMNVAAVLTMSPIAVVVAVDAWRIAFLARIGRPQTRRIILLGAALAAGILVGQWLSFEAVIFPGIGYVQGTGAGLVLAFLLALGLLGVTGWIVSSAKSWLELALRGPSARPALAIVLLAAVALTLTAIVATIKADNAIGFDLSPYVPSESFLSAGQRGDLTVVGVIAWLFWFAAVPWLLAAVVALWIIPLFPALLRSRLARIPSPRWAFVGEPPALPPLQYRLRATVMAGLIAGGCYALVMGSYTVAEAALRVLDDPVGWPEPVVVVWGVTPLITALVAQMATAIVVARRSPWLPVVHAMLSACIVAVAACTMMYISLILSGTLPTATFMWRYLCVVTECGAIIAAATAGLSLIRKPGRVSPNDVIPGSYRRHRHKASPTANTLVPD